MAAEGERIALSAPKGVVTLIVTLLLGAGTGATATGLAVGGKADSVPSLSRSEIDAIAKSAAEKAANDAREDCRRELAGSMNPVSATLSRIETNLTKLTGDVEQLKIDVASMKATRGR